MNLYCNSGLIYYIKQIILSKSFIIIKRQILYRIILIKGKKFLYNNLGKTKVIGEKQTI